MISLLRCTEISISAPKSPLGSCLEPENHEVKEPQPQGFIVGKICLDAIFSQSLSLFSTYFSISHMAEIVSSGHRSLLTRWEGSMKPPWLRNTKFLESQLSLHFLRKCIFFFPQPIIHPAYPSLKTRKRPKNNPFLFSFHKRCSGSTLYQPSENSN